MTGGGEGGREGRRQSMGRIILARSSYAFSYKLYFQTSRKSLPALITIAVVL